MNHIVYLENDLISIVVNILFINGLNQTSWFHHFEKSLLPRITKKMINKNVWLSNDTKKVSMQNLPGPNGSTSCELLPLKDESGNKNYHGLIFNLTKGLICHTGVKKLIKARIMARQSKKYQAYWFHNTF